MTKELKQKIENILYSYFFNYWSAAYAELSEEMRLSACSRYVHAIDLLSELFGNDLILQISEEQKDKAHKRVRILFLGDE